MGVLKTITALVSVGLLYLTNNSAPCIARFMLALSKIKVNIRHISGDFVHFDLHYLGTVSIKKPIQVRFMKYEHTHQYLNNFKYIF